MPIEQGIKSSEGFLLISWSPVLLGNAGGPERLRYG
jgi:hypothetical protein